MSADVPEFGKTYQYGFGGNELSSKGNGCIRYYGMSGDFIQSEAQLAAGSGVVMWSTHLSDHDVVDALLEQYPTIDRGFVSDGDGEWSGFEVKASDEPDDEDEELFNLTRDEVIGRIRDKAGLIAMFGVADSGVDVRWVKRSWTRTFTNSRPSELSAAFQPAELARLGDLIEATAAEPVRQDYRAALEDFSKSIPFLRQA